MPSKLVAPICLFVALLVVGPGFAQSKVAATVDGETIGLDAVDALLGERPSLAPLTAVQSRRLRLEALGGLIDDLLIRQFLKASGIEIEPGEVDRGWRALVESQKARNLTVADYLRETRQTEAQVRLNIRQMIQMAHHVRKNTTDATLLEYFEANRDYFDKVVVRTSHIVLRVGSGASPDERREARDKLQKLRVEIAAGRADFAEVAKKISQCPSAPKGGDIGWIFRRFQTDEAYAKVAFSLRVGEIGDVVETDFGFHLIKVTERRPGTPTKIEMVLDDVREAWSEDFRQNLLVRLRQKAKIEIALP